MYCRRSCCKGADSIQTVEIEFHCEAAIFDNHFLKCARPAFIETPAGRLAFRSVLFQLRLGCRSLGGGGCIISGATPKK